MKIDEMKNALLLARKMKDVEKISILSTIVGELTANAQMVDGKKYVYDEECISLIKKYVKNLDEVIELTNNDAPKREKIYLESFLPKQMTEEELKELYFTIKPATIGVWMKYLKDHHPGRYDGKMASNVMKSS